MNYGPDARIDNSGELAVLRLIRDHIEQSKPSHYRTLVVDVGAHIGMYSRAVVDIFRFGTVVIALEPSSTAYDKLVQNVPESVVTHRIALGAQAGTMPLYEEKAGSGLSSLVRRRTLEAHNRRMSITESVKVSTLDALCKENNIRHVDLLKLDTEGTELNVLRGAGHMLSSNSISVIQFEFGGCNIDTRTFFLDYWNLLSPLYDIYRVCKNGLYRIDKYDERDVEIFNLVNFVAFLR